jgi:hypothetical protein
MQALIEIKTVYGVERIYPINDTAKQFAELTGQTTLSRKHLATIKRLGFEIVVKQPELTI